MPDLSHLSPCIPGNAPHLSHLSYMREVVGGGGCRTSSPDTTDPGTANLGTRAERPFSWIPAHTRTRTWATTQTTQTAPQGPDPLPVGIAGGITAAPAGPIPLVLSTNGGRSRADDMSPLGARRRRRQRPARNYEAGQ